MVERPHYHGHRERLRGRLAKDARALADYEVLELLLAQVVVRRDTKPLAKALLERFGTIRAVLEAKPEALRTVPGFGPALESFWVLLREVRARWSEEPLAKKAVLDQPKAVADMAMARLGHKTEEEFWVALVDTGNRLIAFEPLSRGTVDRTAIYPREVLALALKHAARSIILVHNHPGGNPMPSAQDEEMTKRIGQAAKDLDVRLLEHIIVTEDDYYSFQMHRKL
ncbi:MAG: DNA repair protein RadC [Desulfovibrionaceae bacterium]